MDDNDDHDDSRLRQDIFVKGINSLFQELNDLQLTIQKIERERNDLQLTIQKVERERNDLQLTLQKVERERNDLQQIDHMKRSEQKPSKDVDDVYKKLKKILEWAKLTSLNFDPTLCSDILCQYKISREFTDGQSLCINNIYNGWKVGERLMVEKKKKGKA